MNTRRILLVDDEVQVREVINHALTMLGYEVIQASNGREALELFNMNRPDLVISDIHMPEMNGLELLKTIRDGDPELPVVLITGFNVDEARQVAEEYAANALLLKPFRLRQLQQILNELLKGG